MGELRERPDSHTIQIRVLLSNREIHLLVAEVLVQTPLVGLGRLLDLENDTRAFKMSQSLSPDRKKSHVARFKSSQQSQTSDGSPAPSSGTPSTPGSRALLKLPASPYLRKLGYGTGENRSSPEARGSVSRAGGPGVCHGSEVVFDRPLTSYAF